MAFSVGVGLTNDCNLHCAHCYRATDKLDYLTLNDLKAVCDHLPVAAMGFGTGESGLHPQFARMVEYLSGRGIRLSMASNGYSLNRLPEEQLRAFSDVEVSVDFASEAEQDHFRGDGNWREVHMAVDRCRRVGVEVSVLATMMNVNYDQMDGLATLARQWSVNLRVNVYQPVQNDRFSLSYSQFWEGFRRLLGASQLQSCTEPVVRAVLGLDCVCSPCGHESIRVTPTRKVAPCVYWPCSSLTVDDVIERGQAILAAPEFVEATAVPASASECPCLGGCASRRALLGNLDQHDPYCPWQRDDRVELHVDWAPDKELVRARNYCTTIVA